LWRAYRNVTVAAQELMPMLLVHVGAPTFYFRFLDRLSNALLESMHLAATYACRRAWELLGEEERGWERRSASRAPCSRWRRSNTRGPDTQHTADAGGAQQDAGGGGEHAGEAPHRAGKTVTRQAKPLRPGSLSWLEKCEKIWGNI